MKTTHDLIDRLLFGIAGILVFTICGFNAVSLQSASCYTGARDLEPCAINQNEDCMIGEQTRIYDAGARKVVDNPNYKCEGYGKEAQEDYFGFSGSSGKVTQGDSVPCYTLRQCATGDTVKTDRLPNGDSYSYRFCELSGNPSDGGSQSTWKPPSPGECE